MTCGPFYKHGLTLIPAWISNHKPCKVWDETTYPFLNFNGATVEVWEWISNFIPHIIMDVITYPCWDESLTMLVKGATGNACCCPNLVKMLLSNFRYMYRFLTTFLWINWCKVTDIFFVNVTDFNRIYSIGWYRSWFKHNLLVAIWNE